MSEFDGLEGVEEWRAKLMELLDAAEDAAEQEDWPPRREASKRLKQFILRSSPNTAEILALDRIATEARTDLLLATIDERLASIANRQAELVRLSKSMAEVTEASLESAASIRLERARRVVDSLTGTIERLREFKSTLEAGTAEDVPANIDALIESIRDLRGRIDDLR